MGTAIVVQGISFATKNLGKVTILENVDVTGIAITGSDTLSGLEGQYGITYTPAYTSQKGVTWSIESGSEYASISSSGLLTVLSGASSSAVVIKAVSTYNAAIYATKSITVTYVDVVDVLTSISVSKDLTFSELNKYKMLVVFNPANTSYKGVTWSITSGGAYATVDANGYVTVLNTATTAQNVTVKAVSTHDASINSSATISVTYQAEPSWDLSQRYGIMDSNDLVSAMRDNSTSMLVEFADDSVDFTNAGADMVLYSLGELVSDTLSSYTRAMPYMVNLYHNIQLGTGLLKGIPWTAGTTTPIYVGNASGGVCLPIGGGNASTSGKSVLIYGDGNDAYWGTTDLTVSSVNNGWGAHRYLSFGFQNKAATALTDFVTYYKSLPTAYLRRQTKAFKIKTFIIVPGNFTTVDDVKANRASAYVDIKFDGSGVPYNAGSKGTLITSLVSELTA